MTLFDLLSEDFDVVSPNGELYKTVKAYVELNQVTNTNYFEVRVISKIDSKLQSYDIIRRKSNGKSFRLCKITPPSESQKEKLDFIVCNAIPYEII